MRKQHLGRLAETDYMLLVVLPTESSRYTRIVAAMIARREAHDVYSDAASSGNRRSTRAYAEEVNEETSISRETVYN